MEKYNEALQLLKEEQYLKAQKTLENLYAVNPLIDDIKWLLGLSYLYTGYPKKAILYWEIINERSKFQVDEKIDYVKSFECHYKEIYDIYNEALENISTQDYEKAFLKLNPIFETYLYIPGDIFKAYLYLAILLDKKAIVQGLIKNYPFMAEQLNFKEKKILALYEPKTRFERRQIERENDNNIIELLIVMSINLMKFSDLFKRKW